ncbi:MAG: hypothetical protein V7704_14115 [Aurantimonas endophytica]|uniref:Uncharacterized protein n=1 Tax=Aurantimonas endophytica TaxID=1522175 RepID=A0A7W6H9Y2_9HYPH|nr:hypothetical protein [Aurantimonas endophytica]MBB4001171.1 hypothetical protein [Aurantimonas endophytica]MCO6403175.1 hypothetical protein [Aurantimonas endophytica]
MSASTRQPKRLIALGLGLFLALTGSGFAQVAEPAADVENPNGLVEVSLGDWGVKTALAKDLSMGIADVPLTISVPADMAAEVCPISDEDLEQQEVISPTRTCAAKSLTDGLRAEVRKQLQPQ